jgi:hypothetical protein
MVEPCPLEGPDVGIGRGLFGRETSERVARGENFKSMKLLCVQVGERPQGVRDFLKDGRIRPEKMDLNTVGSGKGEEGDSQKATFLGTLDHFSNLDLGRGLACGLAHGKPEACQLGFRGRQRGSRTQKEDGEEGGSRP